MKEIEVKTLLANYIDSWIKQDKTLFLSCLSDDIIVDKKNRSKGIGKYIVDRLLKKADFIEEIFLNTGKDHQKFYENCDFTLFSGITLIKRSNENENSV